MRARFGAGKGVHGNRPRGIRSHHHGRDLPAARRARKSHNADSPGHGAGERDGADIRRGAGANIPRNNRVRAQEIRQESSLSRKGLRLLSLSGQLRFLAKARLHLAQALFLSKSYGEALAQMDLLSEHCAELGFDRFLVPDGRYVFPLIQLAATHSKNNEFFEQLAAQIDQTPIHSSDRRGRTGPATPEKVAVAAPMLEVSTLGVLRVTLDGNVIANTSWGSSKAREMLLFMLCKKEPLHKEKIVESLWPEISVSKANSNFHSTLYRLRSALYPNCVDRDGEVYQLNPAWNFWIDMEGVRAPACSGRPRA